jgi:RHS repeat-associated protein
MTSMTTIDGQVDYSQDDTGQLTGADYDYATDESYLYDDNGNRITANGRNYITGDHNRLMFDGTFRYEYDPEGNRILKYNDNGATPGVLDSTDTDVTYYNWDVRNRLTWVSHFATGEDYLWCWSPDWEVQYAYDCFNRLVYRSSWETSGWTGATDVFVYDGLEAVLQFHEDEPWATLDAADLSHRYLWNPRAVDMLFADEQIHWDSQEEDFVTDDLLWALTDHLNSVRDLATYDAQNDITTIANHRVYGAFGGLVSETNSSVDCLIDWTGRFRDPTTGSQWNWRRWYDPATGRWQSADIIWDGTNLYAYCHNLPLTHVDPLGLYEPDFGLPSKGPLHAGGKRPNIHSQDDVLGVGWGILTFVDKFWIDTFKGAAEAVGDTAEGFNDFMESFVDDPWGTTVRIGEQSFIALCTPDMWVPDAAKGIGNTLTSGDNKAVGKMAAGFWIALVMPAPGGVIAGTAAKRLQEAVRAAVKVGHYDTAIKMLIDSGAEVRVIQRGGNHASVGKPFKDLSREDQIKYLNKFAGQESKPKRVTNPKHHRNSRSPEPLNVQELYEHSIVDSKGRRWAIDKDGTIHRFSAPSNGETHWNGSTKGPDGIREEDIPIEIRRKLKKCRES